MRENKKREVAGEIDDSDASNRRCWIDDAATGPFKHRFLLRHCSRPVDHSLDRDNEYSLQNDGNDKSAQLHDEIMVEGGGEETADEDEIYDRDDVSDFETDVFIIPAETANISSFHHHFEHVLTNEEVDKLMKEKLKFKWEMPAKEMNMSKLVGTGQDLSAKIGEKEFEKEKDVDYLSSIEVLIIDHTDIITMQNWSHVNTVIEHLNHMPSKQHGTDVMRIKQWYLEGHARFYRQTILLGSLLTQDINALFNRLCVNYEGKVKVISKHKGVLRKVLLQVRQVYERFEASSIIDVDDARLEYFSNKGGTVVFISSYFEFVRIRNFLKSQNASFCLLGEYTKQSDVSRSRLWFFEGKRKIMLYTERAHFYHRYKIRGIKNLVVYSLPERKEFYPEIVNMLEGSKNMSCSVLFSRFDLYKLERIVGTVAANKMSSSDKATFVFC